MCGRYALTPPVDELVEAFEVPLPTFAYEPRRDIAPGQLCPVVAEDRRGRRMGLLQWGFLPLWKDDPRGAFINARAESVASKASFREAFARRRCLIPADGFYEWTSRTPHGRASTGRRTPYWARPGEGGVVSFAGIWETWARPGFEPRHTFAIITTEANADIDTIHDRMPVVIEPADRDLWLDRTSRPSALSALLRPSPDGTFELEQRGPGNGPGALIEEDTE